MGRVRVLEEGVANKIAAGEVVERPASVVKELVENALDAGATDILVELKGGGRDLIRVSDDGEGMSPQDARLAPLPHATSKVWSIEDLSEIATFGFRGEALPSIASVSHFMLITRRREDDAGVLVAIEGGGPPRIESVGCAPGTVVAVHHLFHNTPARLKFLKQSRTEMARAVDLMGRFALAFPEVRIEVRHEEKTVFRSDPSPSLAPRVADVLGREALGSLIAFDEDTPLARVHGLASDLSRHHANRSEQYLFVNRRTIRSAVLARAISTAYEGLLPPGRHPSVVLFLEMDPRLVDPNVHPTKQEVRFPREDEIFRLVLGALRRALLAADLVPAVEGLAPQSASAPPVAAAPVEAERHLPIVGHGPVREEGAMDAFRAALERRIAEDRAEGTESGVPVAAPDDRAEEPAATSPEAGPAAPGCEPDIGSARIVGQALNSYIVAETPSGEMLLIDQHAAHERVLYERFESAVVGTPIPRQGLLIPETVELTGAQYALLTDSLDLLADIGLDVEPFGGNTALVRSQPEIGRRRSPTRLLLEVLSDLLDESSEFRGLRDLRQRLAATAACKAAVKQGDSLTRAEMEGLLADLSQAEVRFTCPHARPAVVRLSRMALDALFHRR